MRNFSGQIPLRFTTGGLAAIVAIAVLAPRMDSHGQDSKIGFRKPPTTGRGFHDRGDQPRNLTADIPERIHPPIDRTAIDRSGGDLLERVKPEPSPPQKKTNAK